MCRSIGTYYLMSYTLKITLVTVWVGYSLGCLYLYRPSWFTVCKISGLFFILRGQATTQERGSSLTSDNVFAGAVVQCLFGEVSSGDYVRHFFLSEPLFPC